MSKPLTVAWISDFPIEWLPDIPAALQSLPRRHPATWQIVLLSELEKRPEWRIKVVLFRGRIEKDVTFERNGVEFHVLKAPALLRMGTLFARDTWMIRSLLRKIQPDLVHAWGTEKGAGLIARRLGYPYLMTVQGLLGWYKEMLPLPAYERVIERIERAALPHAPVVTTESKFAVQWLAKKYPQLRVHQAEHAPNRAFFQVIRKPQITPPLFISIGTLGFRKGTDLLFDALDKLDFDFRVKLITSSAPKYQAELRKRVSARTWDRVEFFHDILPHQVAQELESPTMLLLPTRADTSPNAVKEAVVAGVPVIASEVGGIPDYVHHGKNGLLFQTGQLDTFLTSIRSSCSHPLFSKGLVDSQALAETRKYLSPERMAEEFQKAYYKALGKVPSTFFEQK